jgi:hypothetical protein
MPGSIDLPEELTRGPFTPADARAVGVGADVLRGRRFEALHHGVRTLTAAGRDLEQRCLALAAVVPRAAFSHGTAAALLGLPLPSDLATDDCLHVTTPLGLRAPRRAAVSGHSGDLGGLVQLLPSGLRVVTAPACWAQLSAGLGLADLVAIGDAAVGRGLASLTQLARTVEDPRHRRGRCLRRRALPLLDGRSASPMESRLRVLMVLAGLPAPSVNRDVVEDGEWLACPDLSYPELKIAIEYEGDHHRSDRRQWRHDKARRRLLEDHGWLVIEVTADDVYLRPDLLVARIKAAIMRRRAELT